MKSKRAFTLIELLVVIAIIAILALLVSAAAGSFQKKAQVAQSMANLKQLASGFLNYVGTHDGELPPLGDAQPGWGKPDEKSANAWYHSVPKAAGARGLGEFDRPDSFYEKQNLLFFPVAKYPKSKLSRPNFAVALNASLYGNAASRKDDPTRAVRLSNMQMPATTVVFMEVGLQDEEVLPGQNPGTYTGSAHGTPEGLVARYNQVQSKDMEERRESATAMVFGDGHVEVLKVKDVLDTTGHAYFPQLRKDNGLGSVSWTMDPEEKP
ncbi:MAG TPA: prepilin-type N-terminal cleavage/methylation domain-containing protein [Chthoniobacteraceae bacterium]|nr:prepilin-type N-terminal cleavage/methylation domain-containing protein [Chthoniobacteraceae bacterium]